VKRAVGDGVRRALSGPVLRLAAGVLALVALFAVAVFDLSLTPGSTDDPPAQTTGQPTQGRAQGKHAPDELIVPSVSIRAPVIPIEMNGDGVLTPPADVHTVGWWQRSARPGAATGQLLLTGHSVRLGEGVMDRLGDLSSGDKIRVRAGKQTATYRTTKVFVYTRDEVAAHAQELFGQDRDDGRLVLVTCTDWNGEYYASNIIVLAEPVGA